MLLIAYIHNVTRTDMPSHMNLYAYQGISDTRAPSLNIRTLCITVDHAKKKTRQYPFSAGECD